MMLMTPDLFNDAMFELLRSVRGQTEEIKSYFGPLHFHAECKLSNSNSIIDCFAAAAAAASEVL